MNIQQFALPTSSDSLLGTGFGPTAGVQQGFPSAFQTQSSDPLTDRIRRQPVVRPVADAPAPPFSIGTIIAQLMSILQQLLRSFGGFGQFGAQESNFSSAQGSSTGDPHLAFTGTNANGSTEQTKFDSMNGHGDLFDSDSFNGGYRVSTAVTQPDARGVTWNRNAVISTQYGNARVSLDDTGVARVDQNGETLIDGQTIDLGGGETVSRNADGSVLVNDSTAAGGTLATTLRQNGNGVDVSFAATNVDLGGDLLSASG